jgi:hypothetical protein
MSPEVRAKIYEATKAYCYERRRTDWGRRKEAFNNAKTRAIRKGVPFTIMLADVPHIPDLCPVLGIPLVISNDYAQFNSPSFDRVVPILGYVPGNVMWISNRANSVKSDATPAELMRIALFYASVDTERS